MRCWKKKRKNKFGFVELKKIYTGEKNTETERRKWIPEIHDIIFKSSKHSKDASQGQYRYDTSFALTVEGSDEKVERKNIYRATLVVRKTGMFLYDMINIKKEASKPHESE